jgi:uncharacterized RDD family membrane protein YckC
LSPKNLLLPRLIAYAIDCVILFIGLIGLQALLIPLNPILAMQRGGEVFSGTQLQLWVFATATVPFLLYFGLMVSSRRQATIGMRALRLKVETESGGRPGVGQSLLRSAVLLLPFEINHALMFHFAPSGGPPPLAFWLGTGFVWILILLYVVSVLISPRGQSIHDRIARTVVVRIAPSS